MSDQNLDAKEFASILQIFGHPDRIRIVKELAREEKDVKTLLGILKLPGPRVSQHLSLLRAYRIVDERRVGRRRLYRLLQPQLVGWMSQGMQILEERSAVAVTPRIHSVT